MLSATMENRYKFRKMENVFFCITGQLIILNLNSILHDKEIWKDPENFRPERHLDQDGKLLKNETFLPFGLGKKK